MNFDNIKNLMNQDNEGNFEIPSDLDLLQESKLPIQRIRKSMKSEIITQLIFIVIFFAVLLVAKLNPLPFSVYIIFMSLTSLITLLYLAKMTFFVRGTKGINLNARDAIYHFIYELKLTLEVYKTAIIAGSLLLPIPMFALFFGRQSSDGSDVFSDWFLLNINASQIALAVIIFLIIAAFFYYITIKWADALYGSHIRDLEGILEELNEQ